MKINNRTILLIFLFIILVGCISIDRSVNYDSSTISLDNVPESTQSTNQDGSIEIKKTEEEKNTESIQPTFSEAELNNYIFNLSKITNECELPCIWGFSPVDEHRNKIDNFFDSIEFQGVDFEYFLYRQTYPDHNYLLFGDWNNEYHLDGAYGYVINENAFLSLNVSTGEARTSDYWNNHTTTIILEQFEDYLLPSIFQKYGRPEEIYLGPYPDIYGDEGLNEWIPFGLLLYYPDQGFVISYFYPKIVNEGNFEACLTDLNEFTVISWNPKYEYGIDEVIDKADLLNMVTAVEKNVYYKSVEEIMSQNEFYENYNKPEDIEKCISVPVEMWGYR